MDSIQDAINQVLAFSPELLTIAAVVCLGYVLRFIPFISNKCIPVLCVTASAICYPVMVKPTVIEGILHPRLRMVLIGFVLGVLAWILHNKVLKKLEDKFGLFIKTGDTQIINKPADKP